MKAKLAPKVEIRPMEDNGTASVPADERTPVRTSGLKVKTKIKAGPVADDSGGALVPNHNATLVRVSGVKFIRRRTPGNP